jgi:hypothetical protein
MRTHDTFRGSKRNKTCIKRQPRITAIATLFLKRGCALGTIWECSHVANDLQHVNHKVFRTFILCLRWITRFSKLQPGPAIRDANDEFRVPQHNTTSNNSTNTTSPSKIPPGMNAKNPDGERNPCHNCALFCKAAITNSLLSFLRSSLNTYAFDGPGSHFGYGSTLTNTAEWTSGSDG